MNADTIAAISTSLSESGIGIVRISGEDAIVKSDILFRTKDGKRKLSKVKSHTIHYGYIIDPERAVNGKEQDGDWKGSIIDEVMVAVMKSPNSYTRENTVEINCHGGVFMMKKILETVLKTGVRLAQPGEFTKRAFLNGRIDLSKAEAVMDVIRSKNEFALKNSVDQLKGSLSGVVKNIREEILYEIAFIESALDDPEHISLDNYPEALEKKVKEFLEQLSKLLSTADNGRILKEGINTVIVGKPNAGKSSFLNLITGEERAIVTDVAGTTRDVLEENIVLNGIGLNIIDTAGIRDTEDVVERIGVEKARKYVANADLILYVADSSVPLDENDREIMELIGTKKCIVLLNKTDLNVVLTEDILCEMMKPVQANPYIIKASAKENIGLNLLEDAIKNMFFKGEINVNDEICITNLRHKEALSDAYESLQMVLKSLEDKMPEDFYSIDLMSAYASLGRITGDEVGEDLVNEIFSKFCMGK